MREAAVLDIRMNRRYLRAMRSEAPSLIPLLRSAHQAELLALLLLRPDQEFSLTDCSRRLGIALSTVHGEVKRLLEVGVVTVREVGRSRLLRANQANRLVAPLTELMTLTYGPQVVIADEFADLPGADHVLVFGSWAARFAGEPGPPPHDVDVLVVGAVNRADVYQAAERAERRLRLPVNPTVCSRSRWASASDPLIVQIKSSAVVPVWGRGEGRPDAVGERRGRARSAAG